MVWATPDEEPGCSAVVRQRPLKKRCSSRAGLSRYYASKSQSFSSLELVTQYGTSALALAKRPSSFDLRRHAAGSSPRAVGARGGGTLGGSDQRSVPCMSPTHEEDDCATAERCPCNDTIFADPCDALVSPEGSPSASPLNLYGSCSLAAVGAATAAASAGGPGCLPCCQPSQLDDQLRLASQFYSLLVPYQCAASAAAAAAVHSGAGGAMALPPAGLCPAVHAASPMYPRPAAAPREPDLAAAYLGLPWPAGVAAAAALAARPCSSPLATPAALCAASAGGSYAYWRSSSTADSATLDGTLSRSNTGNTTEQSSCCCSAGGSDWCLDECNGGSMSGVSSVACSVHRSLHDAACSGGGAATGPRGPLMPAAVSASAVLSCPAAPPGAPAGTGASAGLAACMRRLGLGRAHHRHHHDHHHHQDRHAPQGATPGGSTSGSANGSAEDLIAGLSLADKRAREHELQQYPNQPQHLAHVDMDYTAPGAAAAPVAVPHPKPHRLQRQQRAHAAALPPQPAALQLAPNACVALPAWGVAQQAQLACLHPHPMYACGATLGAASLQPQPPACTAPVACGAPLAQAHAHAQHHTWQHVRGADPAAMSGGWGGAAGRQGLWPYGSAPAAAPSASFGGR